MTASRSRCQAWSFSACRSSSVVREDLVSTVVEFISVLLAWCVALLQLTFEQVARKRNGIAVAEARDGICTICHVRLRPQVFNTVRRNEDIVQCDTCQRILYFASAPAARSASDASSQAAS